MLNVAAKTYARNISSHLAIIITTTIIIIIIIITITIFLLLSKLCMATNTYGYFAVGGERVDLGLAVEELKEACAGHLAAAQLAGEGCHTAHLDTANNESNEHSEDVLELDVADADEVRTVGHGHEKDNYVEAVHTAPHQAEHVRLLLAFAASKTAIFNWLIIESMKM
jgi:hypothetical protein